jgi:uncharacterized RDD family membrane protein YckC
VLSLKKAMKCPKCGFNSFDYLSACKKCGSQVEVKPVYRVIYESIAEARRQKSMNINDESTVENKVAPGAVLPEPDLSGAVLLEPQSGSGGNRQFPGSADTVREITGNRQSASLSIPYTLSAHDSLPEESPQFKEEVISFDLAGISSRARAFLIDLILLFGITTLTLGVGLFIVDTDFNTNTRFMNIIVPLYFILLFLSSTYFVFLQGFAGKTIGKMIFGIRIIRDDGESIGLWDAFVRWLGYFISAFFIFIGFIWAFFDSKSQAWHDKFAGTYVVKE